MASQILAYSRSFGGRVPNTAINLRKLGLRTAIISDAGNDFKSSHYMDYLTKLGIPSKGIVINSSKATTQVYIFTDKTGENHTFVNIGSEEIDDTIITNNRSFWGIIIKKAKILHMSSANSKLNVELAFMYKNIPNHNKIPAYKMCWNNKKKSRYRIDLYIPTDELILRTQALKLSLLMDFTGTSDAFVSGILYGYLTSWSWKESVGIAQILIKNVGNDIGTYISCIAPKLKLAQELNINNIEAIKYG
ncbi:MAG: hypothetical protein B5M53_11055 [Candidatus Cloacimonas sp. 4484_209]|nr:MAG: hypothetical protein B5M53_11055 [Candidatus Cloacimonas sp. 4484_209]